MGKVFQIIIRLAILCLDRILINGAVLYIDEFLDKDISEQELIISIKIRKENSFTKMVLCRFYQSYKQILRG